MKKDRKPRLSEITKHELKNVIRDIQIYNDVIDEKVLHMESVYLSGKLEARGKGEKEIHAAIEELYRYFKDKVPDKKDM